MSSLEETKERGFVAVSVGYLLLETLITASKSIGDLRGGKDCGRGVRFPPPY